MALMVSYFSATKEYKRKCDLMKLSISIVLKLIKAKVNIIVHMN